LIEGEKSKMKRIALFLSLCLVVFICVWGIKSVSSYESKNNSLTINLQNSPADTIKTFWDASLESNQDEIKELTIGQPQSFSDKKPRCKSAQNTSENFTKSNPDKNKSYAVSKSNKPDEFISYFSSKIKSESLEFIKAEEFLSYEKETIYRVKFKVNKAEASYFFLLYEENTVWKIFMITDGYAIYNPNYAKEDCSM
jgi:hypothetical protein